MARYEFHISNGEKFVGSDEFSCDQAACQEALRTVRDIESALAPDGGDWSIEVRQDNQPIFRVDVTARKLRH